MTHAFHESLTGYVPGALFHTGCVECEHRAKMGVKATRYMDPDRMRYAVARAYQYRTMGTINTEGDDWHIDELEIEFLCDLGDVVLSCIAAGLIQPMLRPAS